MHAKGITPKEKIKMIAIQTTTEALTLLKNFLTCSSSVWWPQYTPRLLWTKVEAAIFLHCLTKFVASIAIKFYKLKFRSNSKLKTFERLFTIFVLVTNFNRNLWLHSPHRFLTPSDKIFKCLSGNPRYTMGRSVNLCGTSRLTLLV